MGLRLALGPLRADVTGTVMRRALLLISLGVTIGVSAAIAAAPARCESDRGLLFELEAIDPVTMAAAAMLAGYAPARRASRVDPMVALRN